MASSSLLDPWWVLLRDHPLLAWGWVVMVGACIGSFLNVVVYRLPERMSLSKPGSHCPGCGHAIRWHDNIPVLGWLLLRGRCRDCRQPIAARYPLVELLVAILFAWLWYLDVVLAAQAAPGDAIVVGAGVLRFLSHVSWLVPLLAMAIIEGDGKSVPRTLLVFAGVAAVLGLVLMVWLLPGRAQDGIWRGMRGESAGSLAARAAVRLLAGAAVGLAVWMLVQLRAARRGRGGGHAQVRLPDALIVGGLTGLHCGANVVPVLLLAHLLVLLRRPVATRKASDPVASDNSRSHTRFRPGWLAAVAMLTLFWLD